jgi:hypothetical protein
MGKDPMTTKQKLDGIESPKKGERWVLDMSSLFNEDISPTSHPELIDLGYKLWGELDSKIVVISSIKPVPLGSKTVLQYRSYIAGIGEKPKIGFYRRHFKGKVPKPKIEKTCCRPSVRMCATCKAESDAEQIAKGKIYNQWLRMWVKRK